MIITKTPYRMSFFGGGTDYPTWFMKNEGRVLSATINKYCYITCRSLPPFFDHDIRVAWSRVENLTNIDDIQHPAVREGLRFMGIKRGISITHEGDLPARTGLGSSSSFMVGLLHALYAYQGRMADKMTLATEAIHVEREMIKDNVGCQDQIAASVGGLNKISFSSQGYTVSPLVLSSETLETLEKHLMMFYTGIARTASEVVAEQLKTMNDKQKEMHQVLALVDKAESLLLSGDIPSFGRLLDETWKLKRSLSMKISNSYIDDAYALGIKAGAYGGKLLGAGGGGFLLFLCPPEKQASMKKALKDFLHVPVRFEFNGTQIIHYVPDNYETF
ncbi:MAG: kinase [Defluviitaleaceae bacterium]|nr:kinase [Defluviitaleaceae bacterium]MCL2238342.1 kinase [Defluviitaleaceae bacterium]